VTPSSTHEPFLWYRSGRWAKLCLLLLVASIAAYAYSGPSPERRGDTVVGYALGIVSAGLIGWLLWFGVRKRSYVPGGAPLRGWLSAHVWLGFHDSGYHEGPPEGWDLPEGSFGVPAHALQSQAPHASRAAFRAGWRPRPARRAP